LLSLSLNGGASRKAASPPCWDIATPGVKGSRAAAPEAHVGADRGQRARDTDNCPRAVLTPGFAKACARAVAWPWHPRATVPRQPASARPRPSVGRWRCIAAASSRRWWGSIAPSSPSRPTTLLPCTFWGCCWVSRRPSAEGIELIKRALALQPQFAGAHNNLGTALLGAKTNRTSARELSARRRTQGRLRRGAQQPRQCARRPGPPRGGRRQPSASHCPQTRL